MHISEGILSIPILAAGGVGTFVFTGIGLKKLKQEEIPKSALLTSAFFVASLIHVPLGPSSVHLILNGLVGVILGWSTFPSILVALFLQAVLFSFGGLTTLGVNTFNMAFPGFLSYLLLRPFLKREGRIYIVLTGILSAIIGIGGAGVLVATELFCTGKAFHLVAKLILIAHIPIFIIEAAITVFVLYFIKKTKPELL